MAQDKEKIRMKTVCCSVCGRPIFKGDIVRNVETQCPRCKSELSIECTKGSVIVRELVVQYDAGRPSQQRAAEV